jgi:phosphoribosylglycinamide formyltransferase-1
MKRVAVLLSGRGSNFLALSDAIERGEIPAEIVLVVSNRKEAPGLENARKRGYKALFIPSKGKKREDFDREVVAELEKEKVDIVCLAGFMRLLSSYFVRQFPMRILNIHPSLLPSFPGLNAQNQALQWGEKVSGCTVHFVDEELDHGPIIVQRAVVVEEGDDEDSLSHRILEQEHQAYPEALRLVCEDRVQIDGRRTKILPPKQ